MKVVNSSMIYLTHSKNFHKCYNVYLPSTTINEREKDHRKNLTKIYHKHTGKWHNDSPA
jgi:hypothetical protein